MGPFGRPKMADLLVTGDFSDLKITSHGRTFDVHRAVVCPQSSFMAAAIKGGFEEFATGIIQIEKYSLTGVKKMLQYLYVGDYDSPTSDGPTDDATEATSTPQAGDDANDDPEKDSAPAAPEATSVPLAKVLSGHLEINTMADYYGIPSLCELSRTKFRLAIDQDWNTEVFSHVAELALVMTGDRGMHSVVAQVAAVHAPELLQRELLGFMGDFERQVLKNVISSNDEERRVASENYTTVANQLSNAKASHEVEKRVVDSQLGALQRESVAWQASTRLLNQTFRCRNESCKQFMSTFLEKAGTAQRPKIDSVLLELNHR
ncbi:hypothetical protein S40288_04474 [Stachybotrys chartarum IBT 40288]|nr:hypothetical protein S40288_04474 [Stachybotrys chartarum IBT 40288]